MSTAMPLILIPIPSVFKQINCGIYKMECHVAARANKLQKHIIQMNLTNLTLNEKSYSQ